MAGRGAGFWVRIVYPRPRAQRTTIAHSRRFIFIESGEIGKSEEKRIPAAGEEADGKNGRVALPWPGGNDK
jgi:hypothetical protein